MTPSAADAIVMESLKPIASPDSRIHRAVAEPARKSKVITRDIGKLTEVLNMPLDVFYEITSHLFPIDIIQLSRASRELRNMLLSPSSRHIWVAARKNITPPMPDCSPDISEPFYAHLVFERTCDACGVNQSVNVDYGIPARLCGACWKANVRNGGHLARQCGFKPKKDAGEMFNLLPVAVGPSLEWFAQPKQVLTQTLTDKYYGLEFVAVAKQYHELRDGADQQALQKFVDDRKTLALRRVNFNIAVMRWDRDRNDIKHKEKQLLEKERVEAIEEKLRELGYNRSDFPYYDYEFQQLLHQPRKLTPQIWKRIYPKLVEFLDAERAKRQEEEFKHKWRKRRDQFENHYQAFLQADRDTNTEKRILPGFEDGLRLSRDILTATEWDVDVTQEEFMAFDSAVLAYADEYRDKAMLALASRAQKSNPFRAASEVASDKANTRKGKGKQKGSASLNVDPTLDTEAALKILDAPGSFFICGVRTLDRCFGLKSWIGLLEHWQDCHGDTVWALEDDLSKIIVHPGFEPTIVGVARALGLPEDATLSAMETKITKGRVTCTCGENEDLLSHRELARYQLFDRLMRHVSNSARNSEQPEHCFTFESAKRPANGTAPA
ncbi:hypothetical protein C8Q79DRAFT_1008620 [Trametes meyenii]|nr:hypothetical protein C8Q79DRAFT_1008620 [Trametes meyenii]